LVECHSISVASINRICAVRYTTGRREIEQWKILLHAHRDFSFHLLNAQIQYTACFWRHCNASHHVTFSLTLLPNNALHCLVLLHRTVEVPGSNLGPATGYSAEGCQWSSSLAAATLWDSSFKLATTASFYILSNHSICYITCAAEKKSSTSNTG
jgi:hypothetical protein